MDDQSEVLRVSRENCLGPGPPESLWITSRVVHRQVVDNSPPRFRALQHVFGCPSSPVIHDVFAKTQRAIDQTRDR
jgi:hypothetical protein